MGIYLNPGNALFQEALNSEIYVDKTALIHYTNKCLNTKNKLLCVSRPRRFGKSMALEMLAAYYDKSCDSRSLFENLKAAHPDAENPREKEKQQKAYEENLNRYNVLYLDIQGIIGSILQGGLIQGELETFRKKLPELKESELETIEHPLLAALQKRIIQDIRNNPEYAEYVREEETFLGAAIRSVYQATRNHFVLLLDEWDSIFRNYEKDTLLQKKYIDLLRDLFKNTELLYPYALVYITGILPIKRYGTQSALNNFDEYTMLDAAPLEEFVGFTEQETLSLYEQYDMDVQKAKEWYDGYLMENVGHIYNPNSVVKSIIRRRYKSYWTATGTYESIKKVIEMNFDGLKKDVVTMLGDGRCKVNVSKFQNDMVTFQSRDDVLTFLIHLGYLAYDAERQEVYIPNKEIRDEFVNAIESDKWTHTLEAIQQSEELLEATLAGEEETVAACLEKIHEENAAILTYNRENDLSCIIQIAYYQARDKYIMFREMPTGKGFADVAFLPRKYSAADLPAIIVELKWNQSAETALDQIRQRNYSGSLKDYSGEVLLVGINYDKETKKHVCRIEKEEL